MIAQCFESFVSKSASIRPEHSSSNVENSFVMSNLLTIFSNCGIRCFLLCGGVGIVWKRSTQHFVRNEMNRDANIVPHLSIGTKISGQQNQTGFVKLFSLVSVDDLCSHQGRHQRGASGARHLHLKSVPPHFTFGPWLLHTSNTVFFKCGSPVWFLAPPIAKSWRRAWFTCWLSL